MSTHVDEIVVVVVVGAGVVVVVVVVVVVAHALHEFLQLTSIYPGFFVHSPAAAHEAQLVLSSVHVTALLPQLNRSSTFNCRAT